jgi:hypothetical protein
MPATRESMQAVRDRQGLWVSGTKGQFYVAAFIDRTANFRLIEIAEVGRLGGGRGAAGFSVPATQRAIRGPIAKTTITRSVCKAMTNGVSTFALTPVCFSSWISSVGRRPLRCKGGD